MACAAFLFFAMLIIYHCAAIVNSFSRFFQKNNYAKVCIFSASCNRRGLPDIFGIYKRAGAQACGGRAGVRRACGRAGAQNIYINKAHLLLGLLGFWLLGCFWSVCFWSFCFWGYLLILIVIWLLVTLTVTLPIFITISRFSSSSLSLLLAVSSFSDNICELSLSSAFSFAAFS